MATDHGWVSWTPNGNSNLSPEVSAEVERRVRRRNEERGALLAVVEVRVYENDELPGVCFPEDAVLGVETDSSVLSDVVARARAQLEHWR
jgi:hypothetical protein